MTQISNRLESNTLEKFEQFSFEQVSSVFLDSSSLVSVNRPYNFVRNAFGLGKGDTFELGQFWTVMGHCSRILLHFANFEFVLSLTTCIKPFEPYSNQMLSLYPHSYHLTYFLLCFNLNYYFSRITISFNLNNFPMIWIIFPILR